jgi:tetratricopeptide (TPR) repeat protein
MLEGADRSMTVTGHVEQLHLSRCYQRSDSLSCRTCHDPHAEPGPKERVAYYKSACVNCHRPERCKVSPERRQRESPDNDCIHCHMPRSPTEIPHLAFTHHRIGVHDRPPAEGPRPTVPELRPFLDLSRLGEVDQQRSLGLAYLEAAELDKDGARVGHYRERGLDLLRRAEEAGLRDPPLDVSLARLYFELRAGDGLPYLERALERPDLAGPERCNALFLLATNRANAGRMQEAADALHQLTGLRRQPHDWLLLADCEQALGHADAVRDALEGAVRIDPRLGKAHADLAEMYRRQGDAERAAWHEKRAVP